MSSHTGIATTLVARSVAVEYSTDGTTWTAMSNAVVKIDEAEMSRLNGEVYVGGSSDWAAVTWGKRETVEITVTVLYNEDATGVWGALFARFTGTNPTLGLRWAPQGLGTGNQVYATSNDGSTTGLVPITALTMGTADPGTGEAMTFTFTLRAPTIRRYAAAGNANLG